MHRTKLGAAAMAAAIALGCGGRGEPSEGPTESVHAPAVAAAGDAAPSDAAATAAAVGPPAGTVPSDVPSHDELDAEARALVERWIAARNAGDAAALAALYDAEMFRGALPRGVAVDFVDAATWLRPRPPAGTTVGAELVTVDSWRNSRSAHGVLTVRLLERRQGPDGATTGDRALQLGRGRDGAWRIVFEQLFSSEPDWTREAPPRPAALQPAPITDAAERWIALAPTVADYRAKLATIPADPAIREPMARALFAGGTLVCLDKLETVSCGKAVEARAPARPTDGLDEGCLRRSLAPWAVAQLPPGEARTAALVAMASVDDHELRRLALASIAADDDATRLAVIAASPHSEESARAALQLVSGAARDHAVRELGVDSLRPVTPAEPLATNGDPRPLPRRPRGTESYRYMNALWAIGLDPDARRRKRAFKSFLAKEAVFREEVVGGGGPPVPGPGRPATAADADIFIDHVSSVSACQQLTCPIGHGSRVRFVAVDGGLRIAELVYRRYLRTVCEPPTFTVDRWPRSTKG